MLNPASHKGYSSLMERLNRFPQGAPPSELLARILALLFTEKEAEQVSRLPLRPVTAVMAAQLWNVREVEAFRILEGLAGRALLLDLEHAGEKLYLLPPPMPGFFQFSLMRARKDIDQEALSELLYQYLNMESDFVRDLFVKGKTRLGRVMVGEEEIPGTGVSRVLNYERASEVIKGAWKIGVGRCSCREKMHHLGRACSAPMESCLIFDRVADSLIRHGHAREIDRAQALDILQQARDQNLIQFAENVQSGVTFICNCCACCCDALNTARKFSALRPVQTTSFLARPRRELCDGCGTCVDACPVTALALVSAKDPQHPWKRACVQDARRCLGCGTCVRVCKNGAINLTHRRERLTTPVDAAERVVLMALERGKLQHLIWDYGAPYSHGTMTRLVGAILGLPSVKQALAATQLGSSYLKTVSGRYSASHFLQQ